MAQHSTLLNYNYNYNNNYNSSNNKYFYLVLFISLANTEDLSKIDGIGDAFAILSIITIFMNSILCFFVSIRSAA